MDNISYHKVNETDNKFSEFEVCSEIEPIDEKIYDGFYLEVLILQF